MDSFAPLLWICVFTLTFFAVIWIAVRLMRWARKGTKSGALFGMALTLPSAGVNPLPPPQEFIEQVKRDTLRKNDAATGDPKE